MRLSYRPVHLVVAAVFALALLVALFFAALAPPVAAAGTVANAAGRYDSLVLRDLGGKTAALVQLVAEDGAFTPVELWRSKKGALDVPAPPSSPATSTATASATASSCTTSAGRAHDC